MRTELDTINNELETYVSLAAHDLRAPMRNVAQIADLLREDFQDLGDGKLDLINLLEDIGKKATRLIGDVLSHAEAVSRVEEISEFSFGDLVRDILALLDPTGSCVVVCSEATVRGDKTATQIILRNLVDNAMKYFESPASGPDAVPLQLDIRILASDDDYFYVSVADNGSGFSDPARLFLDSGELRCDSGYGLLGVRRLITARGGSLSVANREEGSGAEVSFSLPGMAQLQISDTEQNGAPRDCMFDRSAYSTGYRA